METTQMEWHHGDYVVTDDRDKIDVDVVHWLLSVSYWAANRPKEVVQKTIDNSICFSVLLDGKQVGFARAVTDRAVFAWIADLIIDPKHRGKGLGKFIMACIQDHPEIPKSLQVLRTRDAHSLYERFGFEVGEFLRK
jgi:GNAT superfamily N-acetyltransferase